VSKTKPLSLRIGLLKRLKTRISAQSAITLLLGNTVIHGSVKTAAIESLRSTIIQTLKTSSMLKRRTGKSGAILKRRIGTRYI
jgi:hypothetical protein